MIPTEDWDHYCEKFRFEGRNGPDFPPHGGTGETQRGTVRAF
jgi:hypothetical protein